MTDQSKDVLGRLGEAGVALTNATPEQLQVLASLTPQEVDVLVSVLRRMEEAGPEVTAHQAQGGAFW
jgi:hypothetical protein